MNKTELDEAKHSAHSMIRAKYDAMSPAERKRYAAQGRKTLGAVVFDRIIADPQHEPVSAERERMRAEMDRRMGLCSGAGGVARTSIQLTASELSSPQAAAPAPGGTLQRKPPAPVLERPTAQRQPASKSASAIEMDRRMGLQSGAFAVRRSATALTFSMLGD